MLLCTQSSLTLPTRNLCQSVTGCKVHRCGDTSGAASLAPRLRLQTLSTCREAHRRRHAACAFGGFMGGVKKALQKPPPRKTPVGPETPPFKILSKTADYELRLYDVYPYISTPYERRDEGFLALGAYMDGQNSESVRLNSTQPVVMRYEPSTGLKQMQLYVGSRKGDPAASEVSEYLSKPEPLQNPPVPLHQTVTLGVGGGEVVAVRLFNGQATESACLQHRLHLEKALELDGITLGLAERGGVFRLAQYGPINSLSIRRNEIILAVQL